MYFIDLKKDSNFYKRKFTMSIHSKEMVAKMDKIKYPPPRHVWRQFNLLKDY
jgi:hypothetical protein